MRPWVQAVVGVLVGTAGILLLAVLFIWYRCRQRRQPSTDKTIQPMDTAAKSRKQSLTAGSKVDHRLHHHHRHPITQHAGPFNWDENPLLVVEAVESGWSRFEFVPFSSPSSSSAHRPVPLWGLCAVCDVGGRMSKEAEIDWEVSMDSSEFMQTVRLTPACGSRRTRASTSPLNDCSPLSSVRMSLPLPGPPLGGSSFPQEAYFEITILYFNPQHRPNYRVSKRHKTEQDGAGDHKKLIQESSMGAQSDALVHFIDGGGGGGSLKNTSEEEGNHNHIMISLGLTKGGSPPVVPVPGAYLGSIGFNSSGSVFLDGTKLVFESEKTQWLGVNRVIGCGFDPSKKKVFLTVDSKLVQVINCSSDIYKSPLYPVIAANADVMVLVNLGQTDFKYSPANAQRTSNPCFLRPVNGSLDVAFGYESSRELFSVDNIEPEWCKAKSKNHGSSKTNHHPKQDDDRSIATTEYDEEFELFEIALHK